MKVAPTPVASRSSSSSSFNLSSVKLPNIKSPSAYFQQSKILDTLHDHQLFNWSYSRNTSSSTGATTPNIEGNDSGFLGIGHFFTSSRSGATTPTFLSRSSSFSAATTIDDCEIDPPLAPLSFKIEDVYNIKKDE